nr:hypothetical protein [Aureimonas sp. SK2]
MAERVVLPRVEDAADVFPDDDFRVEGIDKLRILEGQEAKLVGESAALAL